MQAGYRADIDGLRAVAVGLVVAFHAFPTHVSGGFVGVDVFFVISGYLITGIIQPRIEARTFSFREFYGRRVRRIFPALIVVLLATLVLGWFLSFPILYKQLGIQALAGAFFVPNFLFWSEVGYFDAAASTKPLLHLWSLGVEEQFYLAWPLLLILVGRRRTWLLPSLVAIIGLSFAYSVYASWHSPTAAFYSPLSRLWELGVGGLLAVRRPAFIRGELPGLAGLLLIIGSAFFLTEVSPLPGVLALLPVGGAALVVGSQTRLLAFRPLVGIGLISYPLYLWHWPLLSFASIGDFFTPAARIVIVAAAVVLSWLTYAVIEKPVRFGRAKRWGAPLLLPGMTLAAVLGGIIYVRAGLPTRYPVEIRPVLETMDYSGGVDARGGVCWLPASAPFADFDSICSEGSILVWGDSHAGRLYSGLQTRFSSVAQYTRDVCPPLLTQGSDPCSRSNVEVVNRIRKARPRAVILYAAWANYGKDWAPNEQFPTALHMSIRSLKSAGVEHIILIGPAPKWIPSLPVAVYDFWSIHRSLPDRLAPALRAYHQTSDAAMKSIADSEGVHFLSIYKALCDRDGCITHTSRAQSNLISWDRGHFTTSGARFVVDTLRIADYYR